MLEPNLNDGEVYVPGRSEDKARELYELAEKKGIDNAKVSTTSHGYIVPEGLLDDDEDVVRREDQPAIATEPGTTKDPKEAWNAEAADNQPEDTGSEKFDPSEHSVAEVKEYLEGADEAERQRVLDAEANSDKPRKGLVGEGDK